MVILRRLWRFPGLKQASVSLCQRQDFSNVPVRYILPSSINWYPGHMQKGLKDIHARLGEVDIIIEIHDARVPLTGRCQFAKEVGQVTVIVWLLVFRLIDSTSHFDHE